MVKNTRPSIRIDLNEFKLHIDLKKGTELTLHFNSPSRMFYLSVIALVVHEMKKLGKVASVPLEKHLDVLSLLNKSVGGSAGSSDRKNLLTRIYRKWKDALPNLEEAPLYRVLGRRKEYDEGIGKTYIFREAEKDSWANLFEYKGSEENVRLKFSVDKIGVSLDDVAILYEDAVDGDAWERFISHLKGQVESTPEIETVTSPAYPLPDKPSIAVLPFVNMSGDPAQEYFCDGMTDHIITSLSMVPRLFVIARNSTFVYKGKAVSVQKVAEEQGVRYVLEGSVQKSEDRVRILVQLIDAIKGVHLWSERHDRDLRDIFALQDDIAMKIITALQVQLTEGEYAHVIAGATSNLKALESFWRGIQHYWRLTKEDNALARQWMQKAVELDSNFANAWSVIGWTDGMDVTFGWAESPPQSIKSALACAQKAISLNDSCAIAYALVGWINILQRNFDEAIENGEKAVRLSPNNAPILLTLAIIMHYNGKFDESIALVKNAMRLCPYYPVFYMQRLFDSYFMAGRYDEALAAGKVLLAHAQKGEFSLLWAHKDLAEAYIALGQDDKARMHAEEVLKINPKFSLADERKMFYYFKDPTHLEHYLDILRKAGLK
jgi:adenylate cyclase